MTSQAARARGKIDSIPAPVTTPRIVAPLFNLPASDLIKENDTPRSIFSKARIIRLDGPVSQEMANTAIAELFYYEAISPGTPITMLINSGGGAVSQGWAIIDAMNMISSPVHTCAIGRVASMGTTILLAGAKGHRSATPNTYIMMHEASVSGVGGQTDDVVISAQEMEHTKARMLAFYAMTTGTSAKVLAKKMGRDYFMYPAEALELGVIDKIAGYPDSKAAFNAAARKSNVAHMAMHNPKKNELTPD
jgi:ATP-dependent Clp protease protease subunit